MKTLKFVSPNHIRLEGKDMYISADYIAEKPNINYTTTSWIKYKNQNFFLKITSTEA
jgi:hypothetical protein